MVGCETKLRRNSYDHSRQVNERKAKKLLEWDFVIHRNDGTVVRLHPQWSSTKVNVYHPDWYAEPLHPLKGAWEDRAEGNAFRKSSRGEETEIGTFSLFKNFGVLKTLKFDHRKAPSI